MNKIFLGIIFVFGIFAWLALPARAYPGCHDTTSGVSARIDLASSKVTFTNTSSGCRYIGVATYNLRSPEHPDGGFYYSNAVPLLAGDTRTLSVSVPFCDYVVMAFTGNPIFASLGKALYGSRLLEEASVTGSSPYCVGVSSTNSAQTGSVLGAATTPLPQPRVTPKPLPKPKPSPTPAVGEARPKGRPVPLPSPSPKVLGATTAPTSTNPLAADTGANPWLMLAALGSVITSGSALLLWRKAVKSDKPIPATMP